MDSVPSYINGIVAVLLLTSFVKIFTSLYIMGHGLGLQSGGLSVILAALALALSWMVASSVQSTAPTLNSFIEGAGPDRLESTYAPFMEQHVDGDIAARLGKMADKLSKKPAQEAKAADSTAAASASKAKRPFPVLVSAFLISQLKDAVQIGLMILIPFLVVDLVVTNALLALGATQISQQVVALPLKLLLFVAIDGWTLLSEKLLSGYL